MQPRHHDFRCEEVGLTPGHGRGLARLGSEPHAARQRIPRTGGEPWPSLLPFSWVCTATGRLSASRTSRRTAPIHRCSWDRSGAGRPTLTSWFGGSAAKPRIWCPPTKSAEAGRAVPGTRTSGDQSHVVVAQPTVRTWPGSQQALSRQPGNWSHCHPTAPRPKAGTTC
jgi:hypothetical protein